MKTTIYDVAREARVAASTVSKFINGGNLETDTEERVRQAIEKLNFRPNDIARGLKKSKSYTVGVILPTICSLFSTQIVQSMQRALHRRDYGVIVCDCAEGAAAERDVLAFLNAKMVDALVIMPSFLTAEDLADVTKPVVLVDRPIPGYAADLVHSDNVRAGYLAAKHGIEAGHRDIVLLAGARGVYSSDERVQGYRLAMREAGLTERVLHTDYTSKAGFDAAHAFWKERNGETLVVTTNYDLTIGAVMALNDLRVKIPEDLSFIGFDDINISDITNPPLTMINQNTAELGRQTARLLLERMEGKAPPDEARDVSLDVTVQPGESVKDLRREARG